MSRAKPADATKVMGDYIASDPDKKMPLDVFLASPFYAMRIANTLKSVEGHNTEAQFIILLSALREIGRKFPVDTRKEQWGKAAKLFEQLQDG